MTAKLMSRAFAAAPPEHRGVPRDGVRLLVARTPSDLRHRTFRDLPDELVPGDLVVVNTSATIAGEVDATSTTRGTVVVHVATRLDDGAWVVELRTAPDGARGILDAEPGETVTLDGATLTLAAPYPREHSSPTGTGNRLWRATVSGDLPATMARTGRPIAYGYLDRRYPLADYQTVFGIDPGSAEMPSAARPFTTDLVTALIAKGVGVSPITLHTGLSSQEAGETPQAERFCVPEATAEAVNATKARGGRIVAVGTTVTRALESAVDKQGRVTGHRGWTERVISPDDPARVVDGLVTGWHDPEASHLMLVESVAGQELTRAAYEVAYAEGYLWHEFGDSALLLPPRVT
ncbi:MAG: S-adenosylmethionine:tRNA ribosyltransferase-isomerase [Nocardioides sp.]